METKRTKGIWKIDFPDNDSYTLYTGDIDGNHVMIGEIYADDSANGMPNVRTIPIGAEAKANAEFICEAVNNYESVKSDNDRLREVLKECHEAVGRLTGEDSDKRGIDFIKLYMKLESLLTPKP